MRRLLSFSVSSAAVLLLPAFPAAASDGHVVQPHVGMIAPFVLLLLAIALMPFINKHWWEKYYPHVSVALGLVTVLYYVFPLSNGERMLHSGIEFVSFICLVGSLFVVAGGMHIGLKGYSTPVSNTILLLFGAVLSNLVGTTGASMILIRPYIRNNKYRLHAYHIIFFIFIVSNMGGSLTPIGDPPLFLGYLRGIPFFWVLENLWHIWLLSMALILGVFILIDARYFKKVPAKVRTQLHAGEEHSHFEGWHNGLFLLVILAAVFIQDPPFLREALMIAAAAGSYFTTNGNIHRSNDFNFAPIKEVGFLFLGLFATMVPALDWLEMNASSLGITSAGQFYWGAGALSSFLDNAPTYLNFLSASFGLFVRPETIAAVQALVAGGGTGLASFGPDVQQTYATLLAHHGGMVASGSVPVADIQVSYMLALHPLYLKAISIGAVFFGANTYIGNAPNFMVKSISEQMGVRMPSFFGYMFRYSIPILIPIFTLVWLLFFFG